MSQTIKTERRDSVLEITMNRPDRLNALNLELIEAFITQLEVAADPEIRAVMLRGEGRAFCAGGDVKGFGEMLATSQKVSREMPDRLHAMIEMMRALPKPIVAAVHGACAGAGFSLALACDMVIAAKDTKFTFAYVGIGLSPDGSSTHFLPRHVGLKKATELLMVPKTLGPEEVLELGLVNRVVEADAVLDSARQITTLLAAGPTAAYGRVKRLLGSTFDNSLHDQLEAETDCIVESSMTEDFRAGVAAFIDKRTPEFKGR